MFISVIIHNYNLQFTTPLTIYHSQLTPLLTSQTLYRIGYRSFYRLKTHRDHSYH